MFIPLELVNLQVRAASLSLSVWSWPSQHSNWFALVGIRPTDDGPGPERVCQPLCNLGQGPDARAQLPALKWAVMMTR